MSSNLVCLTTSPVSGFAQDEMGVGRDPTRGSNQSAREGRATGYEWQSESVFGGSGD